VKKRGQALVEFVIILPVFILMVLGFIDIGKIIYNGNILEHRMESVVTEYKRNPNQAFLEKFIQGYDRFVELDIIDNNEFTELKLTKNINLVTPGLNLIIGNPFEISAKRVIYNE